MKQFHGFALTAAALVIVGSDRMRDQELCAHPDSAVVDHTDAAGPKDCGKQPRDSRCGRPRAGRYQQGAGRADQATQNAQYATQAANTADTAANDAAHRADSLDSVVKGLDNYKQVANVSVNFGFNKSVLTNDDKQQLDSFAGHLGSREELHPRSDRRN